MPMANTSLDKFYSTTAAWDPWKTYKELVNEESANGAKTQVIKREFDGVKQYSEERRRQTETDKLFLVDLSKTINKFRQAVDQARINIENNTVNPLNDLIFQFNNLMISYQNYTKERSTTPSNISEIKTQLASFTPAIKQLYTVFDTFLENTKLEGTVKEYDIIAIVQFKQMIDHLENNYYYPISTVNDLADIEKEEQALRVMKQRALDVRRAEVEFQANLAKIQLDADKIAELRKKIDSLIDKSEEISIKIQEVEDERAGKRGAKPKILRQLNEELEENDQLIGTYQQQLNTLTASTSTSGSGMYNRKRNYGGAVKDSNIIEQFKDSIKEQLAKRSNLYHQLNNKNLTQGEVNLLNRTLQGVNRTIIQNTDRLQTLTIKELEKMLLDDQTNLKINTLNTGAPPGYQFVLDPNTGETVLKPVNPTPASDKQKQNIQPMITNAGQIIASENASYAAFKTGSISEDNLDVKRSSALSSLIPLLKSIVDVKQDEGVALYAGINDPVFKKSVGDAVPEVTATGSFKPMPPPPPPPAPPTPPPSKDLTPTQGYQEFQKLLNQARSKKSTLSGEALTSYYTSIIPDLIKYYKLAIQIGNMVNSMSLHGLMNQVDPELTKMFDEALNPSAPPEPPVEPPAPPKDMTPSQGYQAFQKLLGEARNKKSSLSTNELKAYYTSIIPDLIKYYNLALQIGNMVNTMSLHGLLNQVDPLLTKMFDDVLSPVDYSTMTVDQIEALRVNEENKINDDYNNFRDGVIPNKTLYMSGINDAINQLIKLTVEKFKKTPGTPTFSEVSDAEVRALLVEKYNTAKGSGRKGRGRPRKDTKAVEYEYVQADEFYKKSFSGLNDSNQGDNIYGKEVPDMLFKNPGLSRVNKYTEGSGAFFNPSVGGVSLVAYNKALLERIGMPVGGKRKGHRRTKHKTDEI
jgi:hypothetical protein